MGNVLEDIRAALERTKNDTGKRENARYTITLTQAEELMQMMKAVEGERDKLKRQLLETHQTPRLPCPKKVGITVTLECQGKEDHRGQCWDEVKGQTWYFD